MKSLIEYCPICLSAEYVRPKILLIYEAWENAGSTDRRELFGVALRAGAIKSELRREPPLEQFIDGYYCDGCEKGFASEDILILRLAFEVQHHVLEIIPDSDF